MAGLSSPGQIVAIVGAESTGKSTLVRELMRVLSARGLSVTVVTEALRDFCDLHGRTPRADEQAAIAAEQTRRIAEAAQSHRLVLADTTALMIAVYSDLIFQDTSLYAQAERDHTQATMTLLTALDLPWVQDGLIRDGPQVRLPVDNLVRQSLQRMGVPYAVVAGVGVARVQRALEAVEHLLDAPARQAKAGQGTRWRWFCENCDDGECEQHWLPRAAP